MMHKRTLFFVFFILSFPCFSQQEEIKPVRVEGKIIDQRQRIISYAHILNNQRQLGVVAGYDGYFSIGAYPGDTLLISAMSYQNKKLIVPDTSNTKDLPYLFILETDTIVLPEMIIYPWPSTYADFKKEFMARKARDPLENLDLNIPSGREMKALGGSYALSFTGPVSFLYSKFSKEAKTRKRMAKLNLIEKAEARYNASLVSNLTGLKDLEEIYKFMNYCAIQNEFVLKSSDYELYAAIMDCYQSYTALNPE